MEWLSGWLKTVITIILLATFVDLLLPSTKLQRYVKTVMSLFILLALLSPVMQLLQRNWNADQLLSRAEKKQEEAPKLAGGKGGKLQSLEEVLQQGKRLQEQGQRDSVQLVEEKLAQMLREDIQNKADWEVKEVSVKASYSDTGQPKINRVTVHLWDRPPNTRDQENQQADHREAIAAIRPVDPVKPVEPITKIDNQKSSESASAQVKNLTKEDKAQKQKVEELLVKQWELDSSYLDVQIHRSGSKL